VILALIIAIIVYNYFSRYNMYEQQNPRIYLPERLLRGVCFPFDKISISFGYENNIVFVIIPFSRFGN
jgi:hypothetical protein